MQRRTLRISGAFALLLCAMVPAWAQGELSALRVELKCENCGLRPDYTLELAEFRSRERVDTAELMVDGSFTIRHIPYGDYQMSILDSLGNTVHQELVTISGSTLPMTVSIAAPRKERPPAGGVSMAQLQHPPTRKAFQAMLSAQKFSETGNYARAAAELEKAVQISPYYTDAYVNLAVQHVRMGRYQEAEAEFRRALEIGGPNPLLLTDLASAQFAQKRLDDATQSARSALRLDAGYAQAHLMLGMALCNDTRTVQEGLEHLRKAAETLPIARIEIEKVEQALARVRR